MNDISVGLKIQRKNKMNEFTVIPDNILSFTPTEEDSVTALSNELYTLILKYDDKLSVCEILGILRLLSDEISEESRSD